MNTETLNTLDGERSIPSVNTPNTQRWKRGLAGLLFAGAVAFVGVITYVKFVNAGPDLDEAPVQKDLTTASTVPARTFADLPDPEPLPVFEPVAALPVQPIVPVAMNTIQTPPTPPKPTFDRSASRSAVPVDSGASQADGVQLAQAPTMAQGEPPGGGIFGGDAPGGGGGGLGQALNPTKLTSTTASLIKNPDFMLTRGAFIDCALTTRLDSSVPGMASCTVTRDVMSTNGNVVLLEAGSLVTGEYRANLAQGLNRMFVLWSRVQTPKHVVIDLDSPATDSLGASGVAGHVDTHFWQRFGGAMLLSLIDDAAQIAVNKNSRNENAELLVGSSADTATDLATEVLRNTINIPATLYANQGARVGIFVARDLDFSTVYNVQ